MRLLEVEKDFLAALSPWFQLTLRFHYISALQYLVFLLYTPIKSVLTWRLVQVHPWNQKSFKEDSHHILLKCSLTGSCAPAFPFLMLDDVPVGHNSVLVIFMLLPTHYSAWHRNHMLVWFPAANHVAHLYFFWFRDHLYVYLICLFVVEAWPGYRNSVWPKRPGLDFGSTIKQLFPLSYLVHISHHFLSVLKWWGYFFSTSSVFLSNRLFS